MNILFDICHPAHVHFFKYALEKLQDENHKILITSRSKDCTLALLDALELPHKELYSRTKSSYSDMFKEIVLRNTDLYRCAKDFKPDLMVGIGGLFIAQVGYLMDIPSLVFYDGDNALLQNILTYPFANTVVVPRCYRGWTPPFKTKHYPGYHELSYLHPEVFSPNRERALASGLHSEKETILIRLVSWEASHDRGHSGFGSMLSQVLLDSLKEYQVIISSEKPLPEHLQGYAYQGKVEDLHHVMAHCKGYIGESPTMAIEAALLGVPGLFVSSIHCGNIQEVETRYNLIRHIDLKKSASLLEGMRFIKNHTRENSSAKKNHLISDTISVGPFVHSTIVNTLPKRYM